MSPFPEPTTELHQLVAALCDQRIDQPGSERLAELLRGDLEAQWFYARYFHLHATLGWIPPTAFPAPQAANGHGTPVPWCIGAAFLTDEANACLAAGAAAPSPKQPPPLPQARPSPRRPAGPPPLPKPRHGQARGFWKTLAGRYAGSPVRRLILCVAGLLGLGFMALAVALVMLLVATPPTARLTGTAGCCWSEATQPLNRGDAMTPNQTLELTAGVAEITFAKGARVIVEAPAVFQIQTDNSAYLQKGKLVANVPRQAAGFAVATPWGKVVDQGTEFAVEADQSGRGEAHVFAGKVALTVARQADHAQAAAPWELDLVQGEAARAAGGDVQRKPAEPQRFVLFLPEAFPLFGTGAQVDPGQPDPHWQIVASSTDSNFQPRPAVVIRQGTPGSQNYMPGSPDTSQWITTAADHPAVAARSTWTFRTKFDLSGFDSSTARIEGKFTADDFVSGVRLNGTSLPPFGLHEWTSMAPLRIDRGFVAGENVLEVEVTNRTSRADGGVSPIGLRLELRGTAKRD